jgi:hypothetical protein
VTEDGVVCLERLHDLSLRKHFRERQAADVQETLPDRLKSLGSSGGYLVGHSKTLLDPLLAQSLSRRFSRCTRTGQGGPSGNTKTKDAAESAKNPGACSGRVRAPIASRFVSLAFRQNSTHATPLHPSPTLTVPFTPDPAAVTRAKPSRLRRDSRLGA